MIKVKKEYQSLVKRFDWVMDEIGVEYNTIQGNLSELENNRKDNYKK